MLNPIHLRTLAAVVRAGSFADAARRLGYTSSAVSQQVSALERALRMPLFEREAQSIRPTAAAEFLAARAHDVLSTLGALEDEMQGLSEGTAGRLRLGSFPTASERLLPGAIARFVRDRGGVDIELDEAEPEELVHRLQDGDLDLALVYRYDLVPRSWPRSLSSVDLLHEDLVVLLTPTHPHFGRSDVPLAELGDDVWVSSREGTAGAACLRALCAGAGFEPTIGFRSNDYDVLHEFVRSGLGIALAPALSVSDEGATATRLRDVTVRRHVSALHRAGANPAVGAMVAALHAIAESLTKDSQGRVQAGK